MFSDKEGHPVKTWPRSWYASAMADALELHVTMPDKERATSMARLLVDEGLAACVNVVPGVRSIYQWDGRLQEEEEVLCLIKTRQAVFERARDRILALHPLSLIHI